MDHITIYRKTNWSKSRLPATRAGKRAETKSRLGIIENDVFALIGCRGTLRELFLQQIAKWRKRVFCRLIKHCAISSVYWTSKRINRSHVSSTFMKKRRTLTLKKIYIFLFLFSLLHSTTTIACASVNTTREHGYM